MLSSQLLCVLATATVSSAHFILHWPETAGFIDDSEPDSPCGGATVTVNSSSPQVQVDRFAVMIQNAHPQGGWTFRGTTSTSAPYNWTDITPTVNTTGIGNFCLPDMHVPSAWAGQAGVIQVIDNSVDGMLYQCAPVNFVSGSNSTLGGACTNATGFTATWGATGASTTNPSSNSASGSMTMSMASSTASGAAASASSSAAAAAATGFRSAAGAVGAMGLLVAGLAL